MFFFTLSFALQAEHLVGGSISYQCLGNGSVPGTKNYRIQLKVTRDCSQISSFDSNIEIGIYLSTGSTYSFYRKVQIAKTSERTIPINKKSCSYLLYSVCVDEALYQTDIENVPVSAQNYLITYQRCCRNMTISNIVDPGKTGMTVAMEMTGEAQQICNQSPTSDQLPPLVACAGQELNLDLGSIDSEGDSLRYEFCAPLTGGGPEGVISAGNPNGCNGARPDPAQCIPSLKEVTYANSQYSATNPFPSDIPVQLVNGRLIAKPNTIGQYVFSLCVKEYRNGKLLSTQRREMQVNIAVCNPPLQASVKADVVISKTALIQICDPSKPFTVLNLSQDVKYIKTVDWEFTTPTSASWSDTSFNFVRIFSDTGTYRGRLFLNKGFECSDSLDVQIKVNPKFVAGFNLIFDSCQIAPVQFNNTSEAVGLVNYAWNFGDSTLSLLKDPQHTYSKPGKYTITLTATHVNQCVSTATKTINLFPAPPDFSIYPSDSIFCIPKLITFGITGIQDTAYKYRWELSDGQSFTGPSPVLDLKKIGRFDLKVSLVSPNGCKSEKTFKNKIINLEAPVASFDLLNNKLTLRSPDLAVNNKSIRANSYQWDFGDGKGSTLANPGHAYLAEGSYIVQLIAIHQNGCADTAQNQLIVGIATDFFMPNLFTPNGDGNNDFFKPEGIEGSLGQYSFSIFDRWGTLVFLSTEQNQGWDGNLSKTTNKTVQEGVYIYVIRFITEEGIEKIVKGSVTLVR